MGNAEKLGIIVSLFIRSNNCTNGIVRSRGIGYEKC